MTHPIIEGGPMPRDVLPATKEERHEYAEKLTKDLRKLAIDDGHKAMVVGQILYDVHRQELWREFADSWKEYINDVGFSAGMEFQNRKNFQTFILEFGMDVTDRRLSEAPPSKLAVGTRNKFKQWVKENIDEFLDYARLPLGEGGLTRADLRKLVEEEAGIAVDDEGSYVRRTLRSLRKGSLMFRQLSEDDWTVFVEALRNDDDLFDTLSRMVASAAKVGADVEVEVDV